MPIQTCKKILYLNLKNWDGSIWTGFTWLRTDTSGELCEYDN